MGCRGCGGSGECKTCEGSGSGKDSNPHPDPWLVDDDGDFDCTDCDGTGECSVCGGSGDEGEDEDEN